MRLLWKKLIQFINLSTVPSWLNLWLHCFLRCCQLRNLFQYFTLQYFSTSTLFGEVTKKCWKYQKMKKMVYFLLVKKIKACEAKIWDVRPWIGGKISIWDTSYILNILRLRVSLNWSRSREVSLGLEVSYSVAYTSFESILVKMQVTLWPV